MRVFVVFFVLLASLAVILEAVGASKKQLAPSTAADPNFGHSNWDLWRDKNAGKKRAKRYYYYRRHYYYYHHYYYYRRYYYYYYNNYYNNYYYSYYYGKRR